MNDMHDDIKPRGRFAPSPSGRMHLGNIFTALISWLSVKSRGGEWILRIEDLDPNRSKREFASLIEDDLYWLGLEWNEGGLSDTGPFGPYSQSRRGEFYEQALRKLVDTGLTYPCYCTRADIMASQAPHQSDGRVIYAGTCRPGPDKEIVQDFKRPHAVRLMVPKEVMSFDDRLFGRQQADIALSCGDFILRRADLEWAYQLAVVVDDAKMGITEVVRGCDLLLSTFQQLYLFRLLGFEAPTYAHLPLICNSDGLRLAKRDTNFNLSQLRTSRTPQEIVGYLAYKAGIIEKFTPCSPSGLLDLFDWNKLRPDPAIIL